MAVIPRKGGRILPGRPGKLGARELAKVRLLNVLKDKAMGIREPRNRKERRILAALEPANA